MIEVRIHGRGGQGNVVAAYLLASAAFTVGRHCQAFPSFGAERRGAPVTAFSRIAEQPIRRRCQVAEPNFLVIQDAGLLTIPSTLEGLKAGGGLVVNSPRPAEDISAELEGRPVVSLPASALAAEYLGKPMPNVALLTAFLVSTAILPLEALQKALEDRFKGDVLQRNLRLIDAVAHTVPAGIWKDVAHV